MKKIILVFIGLLISTVSFSQQTGIVFEHESWNQIVKKAKAEKKLIFMDAYTSWCGPCKQMSARVFPDKLVASYFNENFINAKIDMEEGEGPLLSNKFSVQAYPTLLFINPNTGKVVSQAIGFREPNELIQIGQQAKGKSKI